MTSTQQAIEVPAGMKLVTQDEFFAMLKADPRDIMPSVEEPNVTNWMTRDRQVVGRSLPGWRNPGDPKAYFWKAAQ